MNWIFDWLARSRSSICAVLVLANFFLVFYGFQHLWSYSVPMLKGIYHQAAVSDAGDATVAFYDSGLVFLANGQYEVAQAELKEALSSLTEETGQIRAADKPMAAKIQFLLGVANEGLKQWKLAEDAYKEALRLNPANLPAKYNLERILTHMASEKPKRKGHSDDSGEVPDGGGDKKGNKGI